MAKTVVYLKAFTGTRPIKEIVLKVIVTKILFAHLKELLKLSLHALTAFSYLAFSRGVFSGGSRVSQNKL